MDYHLKKTLAKFSSRSKRFAKLAGEVNICIVLENERNIKKLLVRTKLDWEGKDWESTSKQYWCCKERLVKHVRAGNSQPLYTNQSRFISHHKRKH